MEHPPSPQESSCGERFSSRAEDPHLCSWSLTGSRKNPSAPYNQGLEVCPGKEDAKNPTMESTGSAVHPGGIIGWYLISNRYSCALLPTKE